MPHDLWCVVAPVLAFVVGIIAGAGLWDAWSSHAN
jgi:hypothetical protein